MTKEYIKDVPNWEKDYLESIGWSAEKTTNLESFFV